MILHIDRRDFIKTVAITAGTAVAEQYLSPIVHAKTSPGNEKMIYRTLGRTGERVSAIGLGGWHIGQPSISEKDSIQLIRQAIDRGITFMDNCWDYNEGASEIRMGKALKDGYRQKVFRLEDPDRIFAEGGALEAMTEAKKAGKVRYIGFTGHKDPFVHLRMLDLARSHKFHFDAVQMPLNVMDAHFRSFEHEVLPVLNREGIAPLGMKAFGAQYILLSKTIEPIEALHYCLSLPIAVQITGIDSQRILDQAFEAVRTFKPLTQAEVASLLKRTKSAALQGKYELYKTSTLFDGTQQNPEWLGKDTLGG